MNWMSSDFTALYISGTVAVQSNDDVSASIQKRHINDAVCPCLPNVPIQPEGSERSCWSFHCKKNLSLFSRTSFSYVEKMLATEATVDQNE